MTLLKLKASSLSETVFDQKANSRSAGDAATKVKNVVTTIGGLTSGSRNLCCISGLMA